MFIISTSLNCIIIKGLFLYPACNLPGCIYDPQLETSQNVFIIVSFCMLGQDFGITKETKNWLDSWTYNFFRSFT